MLFWCKSPLYKQIPGATDWKIVTAGARLSPIHIQPFSAVYERVPAQWPVDIAARLEDDQDTRPQSVSLRL